MKSIRRITVQAGQLAGLSAGLVVSAAPLRMSLDDASRQYLAQGVAADQAPAFFVVADADATATAVDEHAERTLSTTPEPGPVARVFDLEAKAVVQSVDDEWLRSTRSLSDASRTDETGSLGSFALPALAAVVASPDPVDLVELPNGAGAARARPIPANGTPPERLAIEWIVAPLVLIAMLVMGVASRHRSRRNGRYQFVPG